MTHIITLFRRIPAFFWYVCEGVIVWGAWYWYIGNVWSQLQVPIGLEYPRNMHSFFVWELLRQCGSCAWWSHTNGGYPVFADVFGSFLHPIAFIATLQQGAIAGSATTVAWSFLLIGGAGWYFAWRFGLHPVARIWLSLALMFGGHMASRLELGTVGMTLSLAAAWLCMVGLFDYLERPSLIKAVLSGVFIGTFLLSGQGYMQLAIVLSIPLWLGLAWYWGWFRQPRPIMVQHIVWMLGIALLIAAPLVLNNLTYGRYFAKFGDASLVMAQPMERVFVNLMLDDFELSKSELYNPLPYPWAYSVFIGVQPILLAVGLWGFIRQPAHRAMAVFLAVFALLQLFLASMEPLKWLIATQIRWLADNAAALRFLLLLNGLVAVAILALAALALHALLTTPWRFPIRWPAQGASVLYVAGWAIVLLVLAGHLWQLQQFGRIWIHATPARTAETNRIAQDIANQPAGYVDLEGDWMIFTLLDERIKISDLHMSWWIDQTTPPPARYRVAQELSPGFTLLQEYTDGWKLIGRADPAFAYAAFLDDTGLTNECQATARGGHIDITCTAPTSGFIHVYEHALPGWVATVNGNRVPVETQDGWMRVPVPAGPVAVSFRFAPWQAPAGLILAGLGWALASYQLLRRYPSA